MKNLSLNFLGGFYIRSYFFQVHNVGEKKLWQNARNYGCFECTVCKKVFKERGALKVHLYVHTGEKPHKCQICPSAFTTSSHLKRHVRKSHSNHGTNGIDTTKIDISTGTQAELVSISNNELLNDPDDCIELESSDEDVIVD